MPCCSECRKPLPRGTDIRSHDCPVIKLSREVERWGNIQLLLFLILEAAVCLWSFHQ